MNEATASARPGPDHAQQHRRQERRVLMLAMLTGFPLFLFALAVVPNIGPVFRTFYIPATSMAPNVPKGSYIVVSRAAYGYSRYSFDHVVLPTSGRWLQTEPHRGDVVVFRLPRDHNTIYVKRVLGLPGDRVQMVAGRLVINGTTVERQAAGLMRDPTTEGAKAKEVPTYIERLPEGVSYRIIEAAGDTGYYDNTPIQVVPADNLFVLGDNRDNSTDSRIPSVVGFVPVELVIGRVIYVFGAALR
jgi:signal peptidase I